MNYIPILEPRWHDKTVLIAKHKVGEFNQIKIDWYEYPEPFYMTGKELAQYPIQPVWSEKYKRSYDMYVVPLNDLKTDLLLKEL